MRSLARRISILQLLFCLAAPAAWAQSWSVHLDLPVDGGLTMNTEAGATDHPADDPEGFALSVTTPYHVGFGLQSTSFLVLVEGEISVRYRAQFLNLYVEVPVTTWLNFSPGVGWGSGTLETDASDIDDSIFEDMNLWQFYGVLAFRIPWSLQLRFGYHEARGQFVQRDHGQSPIEVKSSNLSTRLLTIGLGYTF